MPIYQLSCFSLPRSKKGALNKHLRSFFWKGTKAKKRISLMAWDKICRPKSVRGMGIKDIKVQSKALGAKLVWKMFRPPHLKWAQILFHKYLQGRHHMSLFRDPSPPRGSHIWNFMMDCRNIISNKLTWNLGKGDKALFWSDSWGGFPILQHQDNLESSIALLVSIWGRYVKDYISPLEGDLAMGRSWRSLDQVNIPAREKLLLRDILEKRMVIFNLGSDSMVWDGSKSREYSSKDGYNVLLNQYLSSATMVSIALCWDKMCLPKAEVFSWLSLQGKILTTDKF